MHGELGLALMHQQVQAVVPRSGDSQLAHTLGLARMATSLQAADAQHHNCAIATVDKRAEVKRMV